MCLFWSVSICRLILLSDLLDPFWSGKHLLLRVTFYHERFMRFLIVSFPPCSFDPGSNAGWNWIRPWIRPWIFRICKMMWARLWSPMAALVSAPEALTCFALTTISKVKHYLAFSKLFKFLHCLKSRFYANCQTIGHVIFIAINVEFYMFLYSMLPTFPNYLCQSVMDCVLHPCMWKRDLGSVMAYNYSLIVLWMYPTQLITLMYDMLLLPSWAMTLNCILK